MSRPSSPHSAAATRVSIGHGATRWLTNVSATTTSQSSHGSGSSEPLRPVVTTFVPASGNSSTLPDSAASMSVTAGNGSTSTQTSSAASWAWANVSATIATMGSPTKRTVSVASSVRTIASG